MKKLFDRFKLPDAHAQSENNRRDFLKKGMLGGLSLGLMLDGKHEQEMEYITQKVKRDSKPAELKITDIRVAHLQGVPFKSPIIRIDTNQGLVGWGEVRDNASPNYALMLKSRLLGQNPCNVEKIFKEIKQFGGHGRAAGGVCGVEMALWDLAGKAFNVPVYQMLGGKYRDEIRMYADTPEITDPANFAKKLKETRLDKGYTFLKMDFGIGLLANMPGMLIGANVWKLNQRDNKTKTVGNYGATKHPFTRIQITDKGLDYIAEYVSKIRDGVGYEIPVSADHFGHFDVNTAIRLGKAVEKYQLAWLEDLVPWFYTDQWKQISDALDTPTLTGEDIFLKEEFIKLIDAKAVDMIHPDLASSGGILETKKIGDYAEEHGIPMAMHFAGSPISFMANVHCAAATENFVALEHHGVDVAGWEDIVTGGKPLVVNGFAPVPNKPGLGVELNEEGAKRFLMKDQKWFAPTDEWNTKDSHDRDWS